MILTQEASSTQLKRASALSEGSLDLLSVGTLADTDADLVANLKNAQAVL
jgi:hypothetical protein